MQISEIEYFHLNEGVVNIRPTKTHHFSNPQSTGHIEWSRKAFKIKMSLRFASIKN